MLDGLLSDATSEKFGYVNGKIVAKYSGLEWQPERGGLFEMRVQHPDGTIIPLYDHTTAKKKRMITVTPAALTEALQRLTEQHPDYRLSKIPNTGNLAIVDPDGLLRGYVDVYDASLNWYDFPEL